MANNIQQQKDGASSKPDVSAILSKKWWITALVIIFILGGIILLYIFLPVDADNHEKEVIIKIPQNATTQMVRDSVAKYCGEKYAGKLKMISLLKGADYSARHGAYKIKPGMSPRQAQQVLAKGEQSPVTVVVNGARGIDILSQRISSTVDFNKDDLIAQLNDPEFLKQYNLTPEQALALFIDDSYFVFWNASPKDVASKIGDHYKKIWNEERLNKADSLGLTPAQVITIASIVDEETNKKDERPKVARLYLNRVKTGMKLQADPTVKFALGDWSLRRIRNEHLQVESPYNTYKINGLPPGPIRTVTVDDIDAVLNAPKHDYLYMCAKDDFSGYHNFAVDYSTHLQNARKYQRALNQRNIL